MFCVYLNAELQGNLVACVLNIIFTHKSTPHNAFSPSAFLHKHTFSYSKMMKQNVVAHPFHFLVVHACCVSDVCLCLEELYMIGLCNQRVCVHLLGVFMYGVSMCKCTHSCPCHCVIQTEPRIFSLRAIHVPNQESPANSGRDLLGGRICYLHRAGRTPCMHAYIQMYGCGCVRVCVCAHVYIFYCLPWQPRIFAMPIKMWGAKI